MTLSGDFTQNPRQPALEWGRRPYERFRSTDGCTNGPRWLRAFTCDAHMGMAPVVPAAESPNRTGDSISAWVHPRLSIGSPCDFGDCILWCVADSPITIRF